MATIQSTKPGEIAGSSVLTGRTPSYRLVLKVDPKTGQYKYEYEVDDKPKAVDAVTTTQAASAADDTKKDEDTKKDDTTTKDDTAQTSFEQTKAALGGGDGRDRQRNITTDDRNFGQIALDSTTARRRNLGLGAINPVFGLLGTVKSMDDRRRLKELGISTSTSREQIADVYSKAIAAGKTPEEALREASITGGVALTDKAFEDAGISGLSINDQLRDFQAKQTTTSTGTASDIPAEDRFKKSAFDQTVDAFGTDVSTTTEATKNVVGSSLDDKIRELENKLVGKKGKTKTRLTQELNSLLDQKAQLEAPTKVFTGTAKQQLQKKGPFDLVSQESVTPTKRPETATVADNRATISTARENLERAIQSNNIGAAVDAAKTAAGFSGMSRDAAQREMDKATNDASKYGSNMTGSQQRDFENKGRKEDGTAEKGSVAAERDKVGQQEADPGRDVDRSSAVGSKARSNEVSDKNGNAVTNNGKAINFGGKKETKQMTRADVAANKAKKDKEKASKGESGKQGRIICSELYRQGLISKEDYVLDLYYTSKHLTSQHTAGYWHFAVPAVKAMRRSKFWTAFWREIAYNRLQDIKWRLGEGKFNLKGRIYSAIFEPVCYIGGYFKSNATYKELYEGDKQWQ